MIQASKKKFIFNLFFFIPVLLSMKYRPKSGRFILYINKLLFLSSIILQLSKLLIEILRMNITIIKTNKKLSCKILFSILFQKKSLLVKVSVWTNNNLRKTLPNTFLMIIIVKQNFRNVMNVPKNVRSPLALSRFMEIDFPSGRTVPRSCLLAIVQMKRASPQLYTIISHTQFGTWSSII